MDYNELCFCLKRTSFFNWGFSCILSAADASRLAVVNDFLQIYLKLDDVVEVVDMGFYVVISLRGGGSFSVSQEGAMVSI